MNRSLWTNVRSDDVNCQKAIIGAYFLLFWHMATIYHGNGRQHAGYRRVRRALGIGELVDDDLIGITLAAGRQFGEYCGLGGFEDAVEPTQNGEG